jgi:hypothetical protein
MRFLFALLIGALLLAPAQAQVALDANFTSDVGSATAVLSLSNPNLPITTASNRALIAQVALGPSTTTVTGCVWDPTGANQALTLIKREPFPSGTALSVELWGLVNPVSGNKTLTCNFSASSAFVTMNGVSFAGVDQTGGATTFYNRQEQAERRPQRASRWQTLPGT